MEQGGFSCFFPPLSKLGCVFRVNREVANPVDNPRVGDQSFQLCFHGVVPTVIPAGLLLPELSCMEIGQLRYNKILT